MENITPRAGLPASAKQVFKGKIFEVWQWEQKLFDGTTATFERIWRYPTVEIFAIVGDKLIIEEQDQPDRLGNVNLPSGRADKGEDPLEEAKRELKEETGYASANWSLFLKHGRDNSKILHDIYYFIARDCKKITEPKLDAGEKIDVRLISFDEFLELVDDPRLWISAEFKNHMLRAKFDPAKKEEFRKVLFP